MAIILLTSAILATKPAEAANRPARVTHFNAANRTKQYLQLAWRVQLHVDGYAIRLMDRQGKLVKKLFTQKNSIILGIPPTLTVADQLQRTQHVLIDYMPGSATYFTATKEYMIQIRAVRGTLRSRISNTVVIGRVIPS